MPAIFGDRVYDAGLTALDTEATHLYLCSSQPTTFAQAGSAKLGSKALGSSGIGAPGAASPDGRKVTVAAFTDGAVTANGTGTHYAIVDEANSRLLVSQALSTSQVFTSGNTFSLPAFDLRIAAPS